MWPLFHGTIPWTWKVKVAWLELSLLRQSVDVSVVFLFLDFDGLFLSNGPGDPQMCKILIDNLKNFLNKPSSDVKPIMGICLGNQILASAVGARTYKLK